MNINEQVTEYFKNKNYNEVINLYRSIKTLDKSITYITFVNISLSYRELGFLLESEEVLKLAYVFYSGSSYLNFAYARLNMYKEDYKTALEYFKKFYKLRKYILDKSRKVQIDEFLKVLFLTSELKLYEEVACKAAELFPENNQYLIYFLHASCLLDIENGFFKSASLKFNLIELKSKDIKDLHFSKLYLKNYIILKEILKADPDETIQNLEKLFSLNTVKVRFHSHDLLGMKEYLDAKSKNISISNYAEIIEELKNIEDLTKISESSFPNIKSSKLRNHIKNLLCLLNKDDIKIDIFPSIVWLRLSILAASEKYLVIYSKLRSFALNSASCDKSTNDAFRIAQKVRARAELGMEQDKNDIDFLTENKYSDMIAINKLYYGERDFCIEHFSRKLSEDEKRFSEYLFGKSIAIVGPVDVGLMNGKEIDSYDIVIRFNYKGIELYDKSMHGSKTHLSIYSGGYIDIKESRVKHLNGMKELEYLTYYYHKITDYPDMSSLNINEHKIYYIWLEHKNTLFNGSPNGLQKIISDIVRFSSGKIKVFNSNLFIDGSYSQSYNHIDNKNPLSTFFLAFHDIGSNFNFLKRLWENEIFEADKVLSNVLSMSEEEYIMTISDRFGKKLTKENKYE